MGSTVFTEAVKAGVGAMTKVESYLLNLATAEEAGFREDIFCRIYTNLCRI